MTTFKMPEPMLRNGLAKNDDGLRLEDGYTAGQFKQALRDVLEQAVHELDKWTFADNAAEAIRAMKEQIK
jgi:uncharacterized membrane protein YhfC